MGIDVDDLHMTWVWINKIESLLDPFGSRHNNPFRLA